MPAGLSCGSTTIKYLVFFFIFLLAMCGMALVVLGAVLHDAAAPLSQIGNHLGSYTAMLFAAGCVIIVIAFYGCCGAVRESHCMLATFALLLLVVVVLEVAACIMAFTYSGQTGWNPNKLENGIHKLFDRARADDDDRLAIEAVDYFQEHLKCCGESGRNWWHRNLLPASCCGGRTSCLAVDAYPDGCKAAIVDFLRSRGKVIDGVSTGAAISGVAIGVVLVQFLGVWPALGLAGTIKKAEREPSVLSHPGGTGDLGTSLGFKMIKGVLKYCSRLLTTVRGIPLKS